MRSEPSTTFGLLRHGKTVWNSEGRIQGCLNSPLTEEGRKGVKQWLPVLQQYKWDRIISSDLGRVLETVEILNSTLQIPHIIDPRLREQNWGDWEGLQLKEVKKNFQDELDRQVQKGWDFSAPGGESRVSVMLRAREALFDWAERHPGERILTVCHQGVLKCLLYRLAGRQFLPDEESLLDPNALHIIEHSHAELIISKLNISQTGTG